MRLIIVSNRLPFTLSRKKDKLNVAMSSGGLATGLWSHLEAKAEDGNFEWVGWPGMAVQPDLHVEVRKHAKEYNSTPIFLSADSVERFYHGFCNRTIWPLFHYFPHLAQYDDEGWSEYQAVNRRYAESVAESIQPGDRVWVHDYQLMLLPGLLRERFRDLPIGFFLHIPFPSYELFRLLPWRWRREIIEGLTGADLVGFHTQDYVGHFLTSVLRTLGAEHHFGKLAVGRRTVKVDSFPMGVDYGRFDAAARDPGNKRRTATLKKCFSRRKLIFSLDRLDYTKGLIHRIHGYEQFLKRNPQWHGKVVLVMSIAPSRTGVESYRAMKREIEQAVGRIVGEYGTVDWTPLVYQYRNLTFDEIVPWYCACDVALITPMRDGMNLVAKEFLAARDDATGVLVLSEMAGAARELGEALVVNPFHECELADALKQALEMPEAEQMRRNRLMQHRLRRYDVHRWAGDFIEAIAVAEKTSRDHQALLLSDKDRGEIIAACRASRRRALLLDYDGTLVPFADEPRNARPDEALLELIDALAADPTYDVLIVSGRPRADLEAWFGGLPASLVAEHGAWVRDDGARWNMLHPADNAWKEEVRPILQLYVDRLPGALLEEKEYSLAWHYRRADPAHALLRAHELLDEIGNHTRGASVQVLEGKKVIEIRNTGINKGVAAVEWLRARDCGFVLAIGDDWTDEDMFLALPETAWTVRVGVANTAARFHLDGHESVRALLAQLTTATGAAKLAKLGHAALRAETAERVPTI